MTRGPRYFWRVLGQPAGVALLGFFGALAGGYLSSRSQLEAEHLATERAERAVSYEFARTSLRDITDDSAKWAHAVSQLLSAASKDSPDHGAARGYIDELEVVTFKLTLEVEPDTALKVLTVNRQIGEYMRDSGVDQQVLMQKIGPAMSEAFGAVIGEVRRVRSNAQPPPDVQRELASALIAYALTTPTKPK